MKQVFSKRLRTLRETIGVSQEELASALGISRASLGYYEKGQRLPDIEVLDRIHEVTGCSIEYLLGYANAMKERYVSLGGALEITEAAADNLDFMNHDVLNFLFTHPLFANLILHISEYQPLHALDTLLQSAGCDYAKFVVTNLISKILDDFYAAKMKEVELRPRFLVKNLPHEHRRMSEGMENAFARYEQFQAELEARRIADEQKSFDRHMANLEKARRDKVLRFRMYMEGTLRIHDASDSWDPFTGFVGSLERPKSPAEQPE